jgi:hypothetical protein
MRSLQAKISRLGRGIAPVLYDIAAVSAAAVSPPDGETRVVLKWGLGMLRARGLGTG